MKRELNFFNYKIGRATELHGKDRKIYRLLEILPGALSWGTIILIVISARFFPVQSAIFIIIFDVYWFLKTAFLSFHLRHNWKRVKYNMSLNWNKMLENLKFQHIKHLVILPFYKESLEVVEKSVESILSADYDHKKIIVVLACEERVGESAYNIADYIQKKYKDKFHSIIKTIHPFGIEGEIPGKGSNISYATNEAKQKILDIHGIKYEDVIVSAFDIDTVIYPKYFSCLTWNFLTHPNPYRVSFQPVPVYNNNIWSAPAISRVVAFSGTFWQMIQQERPERLATFSSHAMSMKTLVEINYWQKNMVSEDSRIFWNSFLAYNGEYEVLPLSYPISMDANLAPSFWQTLKNVYKQQRRWSWGVENVPYIIYGLIYHKKIPLIKKIKTVFVQLEGFWSLATNPIMIFALGWLPIVIGKNGFSETILAYNLPLVTRDIMAVTMLGLILSSVISLTLLPPAPPNCGIIKKIWMGIQWIFVPITITIFGAIPGLDAQTRLMLGKYMGFWVTPKHRK